MKNRCAWCRRDSLYVAYHDKDWGLPVERLMADSGMVRNRMKIESAIQNARTVLAIREEFGSLDTFFWRFVNGAPRQNK